MAGLAEVEAAQQGGLEALEVVIDEPAHAVPLAAIFDMDGLLVDSEPYWRSVELAVFDALGADVRPYLYRGVTKGMRVDEVVAFFRARVGWVGDDDAEVAGRIVAGVVAEIEQGAVLKPGALEALGALAARGLRLGLASGSAMPVIDAVLERFDLRGHFAVVCSALDDELGKPHPAVFLRAAALLDVEPVACLVLEDSLNGCIAAKAARMRVVAVPEGAGARDPRFSIADVVLASLEELLDDEVIDGLGIEQLARRPGARVS